METRIINLPEEISRVESLRAEVFHMNTTGIYYLNELLSGKEYALVTFNGKEMVAGCYFHRFESILMIDQLFVKEEYQNKGLNLGRNLVEQLVTNKAELEELLGGSLNVCKIDSNNEKAHNIYLDMGFRESKNDEDTLYRGM